MKAHPALFEEKGERRGKKLRNTFQRLRPEFSSGDSGLRSFRRPEIPAWGVLVGRRFRPVEFLSAGDFDLGSALLCSLLLTNCEGSHSVRLLHSRKRSVEKPAGVTCCPLTNWGQRYLNSLLCCVSRHTSVAALHLWNNSRSYFIPPHK